MGTPLSGPVTLTAKLYSQVTSGSPLFIETDDGFLTSLIREEIVTADVPTNRDEAARFSELMLERVRVAQNLVRDLDVNLAGAAIIIRMREELAGLQRRLAELAERFDR